jgi:hypothetical protein
MQRKDLETQGRKAEEATDIAGHGELHARMRAGGDSDSGDEFASRSMHDRHG